jgi:hypothetical protein
MKYPALARIVCALVLTGVIAVPSGPAREPAATASGDTGPVDQDKARRLFQREQRGEKLTSEEEEYLNRAKELRKRAGAASGTQRKPPASFKPLCDMTAEDRYEGEDGGLYGSGSNMPPAPLKESADAALARIQPLDAAGTPAADGRIVLVSISMSNATQEFSVFKRLADQDARTSAKLTIVDCAQGGQAMAEWAPPDARPWDEAKARLARAGVSLAQVQVAWVKLANKVPAGSMQDHLTKLEADTVRVLRNSQTIFPNLRVVYLGSRIWAGNANGPLNPEPYAYESAFAARHLIQRQMKGDAALTDDKAPLLLWGPYLWADGTKGRRMDELKWEPPDFAADGVHPSSSGREKVARLLLEFFAGNELAKGWFTGK